MPPEARLVAMRNMSFPNWRFREVQGTFNHTMTAEEQIENLSLLGKLNYLSGIDYPDDEQLRARINEYRSAHKFCLKQCKDLAEDGTKRDGNLAVKWSAEAVKWARLAEEQQDALDRREHNLDLIRHEEKMSGIRGSN